MIQLQKGEIPPVLRDNAGEWTTTLLDHLIAGTEPSEYEKSRYRHPDIKAALVAETRGKCAYCESKLTHIVYGDVEHIAPKSLVIERTFDWANLTLACDVCNTNKGGDDFSANEALVDPYVVNPFDHFHFLGAIVIPKAGSNSALVTESTLELNRIDLVERRKERLLSLCRQMRLYALESDPTVKTVLRHDIENNETSLGREYAAMVRTYVAMELQELDESGE